MSSVDFSKVVIRHAAGKVFLLDTRISEGNYHKPVIINETGERIISLLKEGKTPEGVAAVLAEEYGIKPQEMLGDINGFIASISDSLEEWK